MCVLVHLETQPHTCLRYVGSENPIIKTIICQIDYNRIDTLSSLALTTGKTPGVSERGGLSKKRRQLFQPCKQEKYTNELHYISID